MAVAAHPAPRRRGAHSYFPVYLDLRDRLALVVGGGKVAERKINSLRAAGARVRVVAIEVTEGISQLERAGAIDLEKGSYQSQHLDGAFLVVASTNDSAVNRAVFADAGARHILCNVVDQPDLCSFIIPSVLRRGDLSIAVSTNGKSPSFSRRIREGLQRQFGPEHETYLNILGALRSKVKRSYQTPEERERVWECLHQSDILAAIREGDKPRVRQIVKTCL